MVAFGVFCAVRAVAIELVGRLVEDAGARRLGDREVLVHVVDVHVDQLGRAAPAFRVLVVRPGMAHHHDAVGQADLGVVGLAIRSLHADLLGEAECLDEPVERGIDVFVQQVRRDAGEAFGWVLSHGRPPEMFVNHPASAKLSRLLQFFSNARPVYALDALHVCRVRTH